jgi:hypothetical protein
MQQVLVYSDSLSWGIIPLTRDRFAFHQRWPGIAELALNARRLSVRIIEDCLNGDARYGMTHFVPAEMASRA